MINYLSVQEYFFSFESFPIILIRGCLLLRVWKVRYEEVKSLQPFTSLNSDFLPYIPTFHQFFPFPHTFYIFFPTFLFLSLSLSLFLSFPLNLSPPYLSTSLPILSHPSFSSVVFLSFSFPFSFPSPPLGSLISFLQGAVKPLGSALRKKGDSGADL